MKVALIVLFVFYIGYISAFGKSNFKKLKPTNIIINSINCDHSRTLNLDVSGINVHFYDFRNGIDKTFSINTAAKGILAYKPLDKRKKIYMFVGGFKSNINKNTEKRVREAFKNIAHSYLIIIDHSSYTNDGDGKKKSYERSVKYVYYIGKQLARMLTGLYQGGISAKRIHCIGHSLGSQMLGHVGENFMKATGQKISRITALDPAGPCFSDSPRQEQIRSGVAEYVEVYHCNDGVLGTSSVLGDVDFFVNKGVSQPNCDTNIFQKISDLKAGPTCDHKTCVIMWTASVAHRDWYTAYRCDKYKEFKRGKCSSNEMTTAGFWSPGTAKGVYYFSTKDYNFN